MNPTANLTGVGMKAAASLNLPEPLGYTTEHVWACKDGDDWLVGVTDFAQDQLGEVLFVDLPEVGTAFDAGEEFGTIESLKTVSSLYMPVSGEITGANDALGNIPTLVNADCYGKGWLVRIRSSQKPDLLTADAYRNTLGG